MAKTLISVTAKKTLINEANETNFIKGKTYRVIENYENKEYITVLDEQNDRHELGEWYKHFIYNYE